VTRSLFVLLLGASACAGSQQAAPPPNDASPESAAPAAGGTDSADNADDDAAWQRCRKVVEGRCAGAHPGGGAEELACRDKARARYHGIKTSEARREYLIGIGCPASQALSK
jgi:hypothetical protein